MPSNGQSFRARTNRRASAAYGDDLAYIHDAGFGGFADRAAPWLLQQLAEQGLRDGLVIDLGCGSGIWARRYRWPAIRVLGYDISPSMVAIAQRACSARRVSQRGPFWRRGCGPASP